MEPTDRSPQVVLALAVTREGFPVRSWVLPGNAADVSFIETIAADLRQPKEIIELMLVFLPAPGKRESREWSGFSSRATP
ncbi:hypothetical protein [Sulfidibacter corallicola]|uniref:Uncharacterized protein n=1 Tax=Sulfidibacter corallicola TaxID=2818388 RepID=A0A8A4TFN1_SULCO|nr:hypothetical protein [Sulfidibacter corallicola]QTD48337.1 hypothetical protein J3U87_22385 [Sulfidibacter corallicola]